MKYARLTVIEGSEFRKRVGKENKRFVTAICDCGTIKIYNLYSLKSGYTKSCSCLQKERVRVVNRTHGLGRSKIFAIWNSMLQRCGNSRDKGYHKYGGRGIKVCDRWLKFSNFYADMGDRPEGRSLDRIDNNGDYCPENCRWATTKEQANNQRNNVFVTYMGKTQTVTQWAEEKGINKRTFANRIKTKWPLEKAMNTPARKFPATWYVTRGCV